MSSQGIEMHNVSATSTSNTSPNVEMTQCPAAPNIPIAEFNDLKITLENAIISYNKKSEGKTMMSKLSGSSNESAKDPNYRREIILAALAALYNDPNIATNMTSVSSGFFGKSSHGGKSKKSKKSKKSRKTRKNKY
jgi:hypothetical protein